MGWCDTDLRWRSPSLRKARRWCAVLVFPCCNRQVVAVEDTDKLVEAIRQAGAADVWYTRYAEAPDPDVEGYCVGHNAWGEA